MRCQLGVSDVVKVGSELSTHGFAIIPNFVTSSDVSADFINWLSTAKKFNDGVVTDIPDEFMVDIKRKIQGNLPQIAEQIGASINPARNSYCAIRLKKVENEKVTLRQPFDIHRDPKTSEGGVLNWHLDHFSYYLYQDHTNWLICYIPVLKGDPELANLAIIPNRVLKTLDPYTFEKTQGRGAVRFRCAEQDTLDWFKLRFPNDKIAVGDWYAIDDFDDSTPGWKLSIDLEKHKVVPQLSPFDLLIMRADVIHKTNDAKINRISIRCDAMPKRAINLGSWLGILKIIFRLPFTSKKHRYNLLAWLRWTLPGKFQSSKK
jgi:hypothetical protein